MITVYLGVAALLAWVGFELIFRVRGEASSWRGDARERASTSLLLVDRPNRSHRTSYLFRPVLPNSALDPTSYFL